MADSWYYVDGTERVGPVAKSEIEVRSMSENLT